MKIEHDVRQRFRLLVPALKERTRRLWAAAEAKAMGRGGVTASKAWYMEPATMSLSVPHWNMFLIADKCLMTVVRHQCKRRNKSAAGGGGKVQRPANKYPTHCGASTC